MMKNKIVTIVLSIILFVVPVVIIPDAWGKYNLLKIIVLLVCGFALLVITLLRGKELKCDTQDFIIFIFGILAILSTVFSKNIKKSIIGESNRYEGLLTIITYILIYYNAKYYFKDYKNFLKIGTIICISIGFLALIQFCVSDTIELLPIFGKGANGTFGNTNFIGSFISLVLPAFILGYIFENRKIYLVSSMIIFSTMVMCTARSAMVAFIVYMLMIFTYIIIKKKYFKRFFILLIVFILCFTLIKIIDRNGSILGNFNRIKFDLKNLYTNGVTDSLGAGRIGIWKLTAKVIYRVPIFGCGVDALKDGLEQLCTDAYIPYLIEHEQYIDKAHNEYLQIAATMGIPALLVYLTFLGTIGISSIRKIFKHKVIAINIAIISGYLVQAFFNISTIGVAPIFWFILGITSRNLNKTKTE